MIIVVNIFPSHPLSFDHRTFDVQEKSFLKYRIGVYQSFTHAEPLLFSLFLLTLNGD